MPRMAPFRKMFSPACEFGMKSGSDLEEAGDSSL